MQQQEIKDDNNSEAGSIKSTDFNLQFLEYDSEDDDEPKIQDQENNNNNGEEENNKIEKENINSEEEEEIENKNSNYSCAYCGLSSETHLAKCLECKKWFCNGKLDVPYFFYFFYFFFFIWI